jgi:hypothetical protein
LNRALYDIAIGLRSDGVREWNYTTNLHTRGDSGERELLAAADFVCQREVWDRCINTSERITEAFAADQRFPTPFLVARAPGAMARSWKAQLRQKTSRSLRPAITLKKSPRMPRCMAW